MDRMHEWKVCPSFYIPPAFKKAEERELIEFIKAVFGSKCGGKRKGKRK